MRDLFDLTGRTLVITGSSDGIGLATAKRFVEYGASGVTISSRRVEVCDRIAREINAEAGRDVALSVAADLTDTASIERLVDSAAEAWGRIDTLMAHAAAYETSVVSALDVDPQVFSDMLTHNIRNNVLMIRHALPHMRRQGGGNIIFTSSIAGTGSFPFVGVYSVVKRGLYQLVENLAVELARDQIRVNAISPGFVRAGGSNPALWKDNPEMAAKIAEMPFARIGEPDDIAACAVYLSSRAGAYVTGQNLIIDGGETLSPGLPKSDLLEQLA